VQGLSAGQSLAFVLDFFEKSYTTFMCRNIVACASFAVEPTWSSIRAGGHVAVAQEICSQSQSVEKSYTTFSCRNLKAGASFAAELGEVRAVASFFVFFWIFLASIT
jgi:hypothetical protein